MNKLKISPIQYPRIEGDQFEFARKAYGKDVDGIMNPILSIEHFEMTGDVLRSHPDLGVNSITYIFDNSAPYFSQDENGSQIVIAPGSYLWTSSVEGFVHEEYPNPQKDLIEGLQIYLRDTFPNKTGKNLTYLMVSQIPVFYRNRVKVRLIAGTSGMEGNPTDTPIPLTFLFVTIGPIMEFVHLLPMSWSGSIMVLEGRLYVSTEEETHELEEGMVLSMSGSEQDETIKFIGITQCEFVFISSQPAPEGAPSIALNTVDS